MSGVADLAIADMDDFRCSTWNRALSVDPIGSAGEYDGYLVIEWPLPWPVDLGEVRALEVLAAAARGARLRLQAAVPPSPPDPGAPPKRLRVALYDRDAPSDTPGWFAGLRVRALEVAPGDVGAAALSLIEDPRVASSAPGVGASREVLVCTHGRRDRCCGSLGTTLAAALTRQPELLGEGVRLARTSHTGGHRFAPTAIVLPEATSWAYLDAPLLGRIVAGSAEPSEAAPHYRGCALVGPPVLQALERAVFAAEGGPGFELFGLARTGSVGSHGAAVLHVRRRDGQIESFGATVRRGRRVPIPACGLPIEDAKAFEDQLEVHDLRRV